MSTWIFNGRCIRDEQVKLHYDSKLFSETCGGIFLFFLSREQNFLIINNFSFQIFFLCVIKYLRYNHCMKVLSKMRTIQDLLFGISLSEKLQDLGNYDSVNF